MSKLRGGCDSEIARIIYINQLAMLRMLADAGAKMTPHNMRKAL